MVLKSLKVCMSLVRPRCGNMHTRRVVDVSVDTGPVVRRTQAALSEMLRMRHATGEPGTPNGRFSTSNGASAAALAQHGLRCLPFVRFGPPVCAYKRSGNCIAVAAADRV